MQISQVMLKLQQFQWCGTEDMVAERHYKKGDIEDKQVLENDRFANKS